MVLVIAALALALVASACAAPGSWTVTQPQPFGRDHPAGYADDVSCAGDVCAVVGAFAAAYVQAVPSHRAPPLGWRSVA